jgi:alanine racemase
MARKRHLPHRKWPRAPSIRALRGWVGNLRPQPATPNRQPSPVNWNVQDLKAIRPCWVEIDTLSFEGNYRYLTSLAADAELLAVVKANAYGHSLALCAPAAVRAGAAWLGVTCVDEGIAARAICPQARILAMSGSFPGQAAAAIEHALTAVVWEPWQLDELEHAAHLAGAPHGAVPVHLEIDTGMSRQGVAHDDFNGLASLLARLGPESPLRLEGVVTHLFAADETDGRVNELQRFRLATALGQIAEAGITPEWLSVGASAALLRGDAGSIVDLASRFGLKAMLRPGISLYGVAPAFIPDEPERVTTARQLLKPVLAWKTRVTGVRSVEAGAVVGYNGTFLATEPMRLALLPVGYADGLDRRLGNRFSLLVRGERAPLVGRISMDLAVVDVTGIEGVQAGDEVVILGSQRQETVSAQDHAQTSETIPWEVFTRITARVPRAHSGRMTGS